MGPFNTPTCFSHMRSDGVSEGAVPSATHLSVIPATHRLPPSFFSNTGKKNVGKFAGRERTSSC